MTRCPRQLIAGARGRGPMNVDAIAGTLVSLGRLLEEQPQIEQVDLNPCLALRRWLHGRRRADHPLAVGAGLRRSARPADMSRAWKLGT